jgi:ABC-type ATPase involved in cell division
VLEVLEKDMNQQLSSQHKQRCIARARYFILEPDGLLRHIPTGNLCISDNKELKRAILEESHNSPTGGHFGEKQIVSVISRRFFW